MAFLNVGVLGMAVFGALDRMFQILDQFADQLSLRHSLISQKNSSTAAQAAHQQHKNIHTLGNSSYWRTSLRVWQDSQPFISARTILHPVRICVRHPPAR